MNSYDSAEFFSRLLAAVHELFTRHPEFAERVALQAKLYRELAVAEPTTLRAQLSDLHASPDLPPELAQSLEEFFSGVSRDAPADFAYCPPAQYLYTYLQRAVAASSNELVHRHLGAALTFDMRVLRAALIEAARPGGDIGFERKVRTLAEMIRSGAEQWYRPILRCALAISYEVNHKVKATVPNELGALMGVIRDSKTLPTSILDDRVRIIRNAVAHSGVTLDLEKATVSFTNHKRGGSSEVLGPFTWESLVDLAWTYILTWSALALVCRRMLRLTSKDAN